MALKQMPGQQNVLHDFIYVAIFHNDHPTSVEFGTDLYNRFIQ